LQWGFPIATTLSLNKLISINGKKKWWRFKPGLAKRRALFPEGRGLGVGGRKRGSKRKNKKKARGPHRRIYIRRSIRKGEVEVRKTVS